MFIGIAKCTSQGGGIGVIPDRAQQHADRKAGGGLPGEKSPWGGMGGSCWRVDRVDHRDDRTGRLHLKTGRGPCTRQDRAQKHIDRNRKLLHWGRGRGRGGSGSPHTSRDRRRLPSNGLGWASAAPASPLVPLRLSSARASRLAPLWWSPCSPRVLATMRTNIIETS